MKLIIALGNPGKKYEKTRHNAGWMVLDKLCQRAGDCRWENKKMFLAEVADLELEEQRVFLIKPQTFMNNSGEAAAALARFYKISSADIWLIHDDLDLPLGSLRVREGGSSGGHKGVASVIDALATRDFPRFRLGIAGGGRDAVPAEKYVLEPFEREEKPTIKLAIERAAEAALFALRNGIEKTQSNYP